MPARYHTWRS